MHRGANLGVRPFMWADIQSGSTDVHRLGRFRFKSIQSSLPAKGRVAPRASTKAKML